jgi:hypothetical protein
MQTCSQSGQSNISRRLVMGKTKSAEQFEAQIKARIDDGMAFIEKAQEFFNRPKPPTRREILTKELREVEKRYNDARRESGKRRHELKLLWESIAYANLEEVPGIAAKCTEAEAVIKALDYCAAQADATIAFKRLEISNLPPDGGAAEYQRLKARALAIRAQLQSLNTQQIDPRTNTGKHLDGVTLTLGRELSEINTILNRDFGFTEMLTREQEAIRGRRDDRYE